MPGWCIATFKSIEPGDQMKYYIQYENDKHAMHARTKRWDVKRLWWPSRDTEFVVKGRKRPKTNCCAVRGCDETGLLHDNPFSKDGGSGEHRIHSCFMSAWLEKVGKYRRYWRMIGEILMSNINPLWDKGILVFGIWQFSCLLLNRSAYIVISSDLQGIKNSFDLKIYDYGGVDTG